MNRQKSQALAAGITVILHDCFGNARKAIEQLSDEAVFVMGLAHLPNRSIRHAWVQASGEVLDPTWANEPEQEVRYEAKHRWSRSEAIARVPIPPNGGLPMCGAPEEIQEWYAIEESP
jgi:hypothetical protein